MLKSVIKQTTNKDFEVFTLMKISTPRIIFIIYRKYRKKNWTKGIVNVLLNTMH